MAEGAPLLREYTLIAYRGFESLLLRHPKEGGVDESPLEAARAFYFSARAESCPEFPRPYRLVSLRGP